jgi:hypothetical protein
MGRTCCSCRSGACRNCTVWQRNWTSRCTRWVWVCGWWQEGMGVTFLW